jgi:hypothetical protein
VSAAHSTPNDNGDAATVATIATATTAPPSPATKKREQKQRAKAKKQEKATTMEVSSLSSPPPVSETAWKQMELWPRLRETEKAQNCISNNFIKAIQFIKANNVFKANGRNQSLTEKRLVKERPYTWSKVSPIPEHRCRLSDRTLF